MGEIDGAEVKNITPSLVLPLRAIRVGMTNSSVTFLRRSLARLQLQSDHLLVRPES